MEVPEEHPVPRSLLVSRVVRWGLWAVAVVVVLLLVVLGALQLPPVQTRLAQLATDYLSERLGYPLSVDRVSIRWLDEAVLEGVTVRDPAREPIIHVPSLRADFDLRTLWQPGRIVLDEVTLNAPAVQLLVDRRTGELNINGFIAAINDLTSHADADTTARAPISFEVARVHLNEAYVYYADQTRDSFPEGFNYYRMAYDSLRAEIRDLRIAQDTVQMQIDDLRTVERNSDLRVRELDSFFRFCGRSMDFYGLRARIGESYLGDTLRFAYDSTDALGAFTTRVNIAANLENAVIEASDLARFAPALRAYDERLIVRGHVKGTVGRFGVDDLNLYFGDNSYLFGSVRMIGLPDFRSTFIELSLSGAQIAAPDLRQYIPSNQA
ncbi:MAG: hypothetical protein WBA12_11750, partial [Catalinimonas sp.]